MQGVDLNVEPPVEDSAPPRDTLPIVRSTSTRDYQISLIAARGPNSRGAQMLRAGLASIGKPDDPQPLPTMEPTILLTPPRPLATREAQIAIIEARGPNSRGVQLLHAGLADLARTTPPKPSPPMVSLTMEAPSHPQCDGQFFRLYPKYARS